MGVKRTDGEGLLKKSTSVGFLCVAPTNMRHDISPFMFFGGDMAKLVVCRLCCKGKGGC